MSKIDLKSMEIQLGERDTERTLKNDLKFLGTNSCCIMFE